MFKFNRTIALLGVLAFGTSVWAEQITERLADAGSQDVKGSLLYGTEVGMMAPDFNLMPLKVYEFGIEGQKSMGKKMVFKKLKEYIGNLLMRERKSFKYLFHLIERCNNK